MLDLHTGEHDFTEVNPPILVKDEAMFGTAQLPKFRDDQFLATRNEAINEAINRTVAERYETNDNSAEIGGLDVVKLEEKYWLIPTAEVPLTNLVRESDSGPKRASSAVYRLHAVLSRRSGISWARYARHDSPASVRQGRAGVDYDAGAVAGRA